MTDPDAPATAITTSLAQAATTATLPPSPNITLALSGGGFRATLYHLGVIKYLCLAGLLPQVKRVVSVSGGSILAAHLVLNWKQYRDPNQFDAVAAKLVKFAQSNVRVRIIERWLTRWLVAAVLFAILASMLFAYQTALSAWGAGVTAWLGWPLEPSSAFLVFECSLLVAAGLFVLWQRLLGRTDLLQREFDAFFEAKMLSDLNKDGAPTLQLLATSLTSGRLCWFTDAGFSYLDCNRFIHQAALALAGTRLWLCASDRFVPPHSAVAPG